MIVMYYLMLEGLSKMDGNGYETHNKSVEYNTSLNKLSEDEKDVQKQKITHFF